MPENTSGQEKTEAPSARKREEARRQGQVAKSVEVNTALVLLAGTAFFFFAGRGLLTQIMVFWKEHFQQVVLLPVNQEDLFALISSLGLKILYILGPFLLLVSLVGLASNLAQVGFMWSTEALAPKFEKLNIIAGFKRLVSPRSLVELLKGLLKLTIIGLVIYVTLHGKIELFFQMMQESVGHILQFLARTAGEVMFKVALALLLLAVADYGYQRWEFEKNLRMTKEEAKEEQKMVEGNPQIKARIREVQRSAARRRMMAKVPEADVVITNPIHYAVALKYEPGEYAAPIIVAKGERKIAQRIKAIAEEHGVPIYEDPPLAQLLFKRGEVGQEIPIDAYQAVAEILSYIYMMRNQKPNLN
ncbi:MAG: flagellar biosynthesis protein FlhB [candidate division KSB1 bacterium]|nr:flagellar biosynthesis protein FlhB [candidate division KSB1 bacterium]